MNMIRGTGYISLHRILLLLCIVCLHLEKTSAQIAAGKCKFLGNVIAGYTPSDYTQLWNQVTPENAGKWGSVEAVRDVMQWAALDNAYRTAKDNGLPFKQHTLVWGQQQPAWLADLSLAEQKEEVEEWIRLFSERYPDTDFIDVVNEPLHATPIYDQALGTGWNWVIWTFEKARQYCPNAKLILNDYNILNSTTSTDAYIGLINLLKEKNLIDIIGEQGHFLESTPIATIKTNLQKLQATGLPIHISEFDIHLADDVEQLNKYKELFPVLWENPAVQGITLWGYKQGEIWRENAFLLNSGGIERPALAWLKSYIPTAPGGTFCQVITDVKEEQSWTFSFYPNPSNGKNLTLHSIGSDAYVTVMTLQGQTISNIHLLADQLTSLPLECSPQTYILKILRDEKVSFEKLIIR